MTPLGPLRRAFRFFKSLQLARASVPWLMEELQDVKSRLATVEHHVRKRPLPGAVEDLLARSREPAGPPPAVSVVIPCFNHAHHLAEAVASVAAQTLADLEVLVVNDCSADATNETVLALAAAHPRLALRLFLNDANLGLAATRNVGFQHARAPAVFPLDADNRLTPTCLAEMRAALDDDAGAAFVYSWRQEFGASDALVKPPAFDRLRFARGNYIDAMALVRKDAWQAAGGYKTSMRHGWEDYEFWLNLASRGMRGRLLAKPLVEYRVAPASMVRMTLLHQLEIRKRLRALYPDVFTD